MPDDVCPDGVPAEPGHDYAGPIGGPYRCDCGAVQPAVEVRLLLTGRSYRRDVDEILADLPKEITVTTLPDTTGDLHARVLAVVDDCRCLIPAAMTDVVMAVVQPELDRLTAERDEALASLRAAAVREHEQAQRINRLRRERNHYRAAWQSARKRAARLSATLADLDRIHSILTIREQAVRGYCLMLLRDSCRVAARETAQDVLRLLDGARTSTSRTDRTEADVYEHVPCGFGGIDPLSGFYFDGHGPHAWKPQPGKTPAWCPGSARGSEPVPNPPYDLPDGFRAGPTGEP